MLSEELAAMDLPPGVEQLLSPKASQSLKMILSGKVSGPVVEEFRKIQRELGEAAAFDFLEAEADGFHVTPYGYCITSFTVSPCPKHLECFNGCRHLTLSPVEEHKENLVTIRNAFRRAITQIEERPSTSVGRENQLRDARTKLANIEASIEAQAGSKPFPNGADLSAEEA
jgi:hypothetical protein